MVFIKTKSGVALYSCHFQAINKNVEQNFSWMRTAVKLVETFTESWLKRGCNYVLASTKNLKRYLLINLSL